MIHPEYTVNTQVLGWMDGFMQSTSMPVDTILESYEHLYKKIVLSAVCFLGFLGLPLGQVSTQRTEEMT